MPASRSATPERIKDANLRYHDAAAAGYDSKWGIDFGPIGQEQVRAKLTKALGGWPESPFGEALEIGSGTGYFSLNLLQLGLIGRLVATDISPGMLGELAATAERLGLEVETETTDAERLPFEDESFDLVFGHAVLHHLPDLPAGPCRAPAGAAPRRHAGVLRRAVALRRPARRGAEARRAAGGAALAAGAQGPRASRGPGRAPGRASARARGGRARIRRREARADAARGRVRAGEDSRRGAPGERLRVDGSHARGNGRPRAGPRPLAPVRLPQLPRASAPRRLVARAAAAGIGLLQPGALGAQAGP